jgi:site-specific DNA recombinase
MLGIYCRISKKKEEGKDVSIATQKDGGIKFAKQTNQLYKLFIDEGISGAKSEIKNRPKFAELLDAIKKKEINAVYCFDQSRIERNNKVWNLFAYMMLETGAKYYPAGKLFDLNDPQNKFISGIISLTNELYATLTGEKVKLALEMNAKKGKAHGLTAYGYEKDDKGYFRINKYEAGVVKRIYNLSLKGVGAYTIANILNNEGIPTKFNSFTGNIKRKDSYTGRIYEYNKKEVKWRGNVIHDMIRNPIYKGVRKWGEYEAKIDPIIDEQQWELVNKNLKTNKKKAGKREEYRYLLNGLIFCVDCKSEFRGKKRLKGNDNAYKCNGKSYYQSKCNTSRGISIPKLETFIITHLFLSKDLEKFLTGLTINNDETNALKVKCDKLKKQLPKIEFTINKSYQLLYEDDLKDDDRIKADYIKAKKAKSDLDAQIDFLEKEIIERESNQRQKRVKKLIGEYSFSADFETTKSLIHSLIEKITIQHRKEGKRGFFHVAIKYKGFDETSVFITDWQALKWYWMSRYRAYAITDEDLAEDLDQLKGLKEFYGDKSDINPDFKGFETSTLMHEVIILKKENLIDFD